MDQILGQSGGGCSSQSGQRSMEAGLARQKNKALLIISLDDHCKVGIVNGAVT